MRGRDLTEPTDRLKIQALVTFENMPPLKRPQKNVAIKQNDWMPAFHPGLHTEAQGSAFAPGGSFHAAGWDTLVGLLARVLSPPLTCCRICHRCSCFSLYLMFVIKCGCPFLNEACKTFLNRGCRRYSPIGTKVGPCTQHVPTCLHSVTYFHRISSDT